MLGLVTNVFVLIALIENGIWFLWRCFLFQMLSIVGDP
jgi:hypothetical protein